MHFVTERAVFELRPEEGLVLAEIAPGVDLQKDVLDQMEFVPKIAEPLARMNEGLFKDMPFGLRELMPRA
jgi:propionate CoA-transferase